jgi:hypothetical protein
MQKFTVTTWPDKTAYTIEMSIGDVTDLHNLTPRETSDLLDCLVNILSGSECDHINSHRIEAKQGNMFVLMMAASDRYSRAYTVSKRKLIELKVGLMGALNG